MQAPPTPIMSIQPAKASQVKALTQLMHRAKAHWGYLEEDMLVFRAHWHISKQFIEDNSVFVVISAKQIAGFVSITPSTEENCAIMAHLFVDPVYHGKAIGRALLHSAEEHCKQKGYSTLTLESDPHAAPFYQRHGYQITGERPSSFQNCPPIKRMQRTLSPHISRLQDIELTIDRGQLWEFEEQNRAAIAADFAKRQQQNPHLWNGRLLHLTHYELDAGTLRGNLVETSFAAFMAWRTWGLGQSQGYNLFGSAVIRSSEGHLVFGEMANHTATAGSIYPFGGNLDLNDITAQNNVDVLGSIARELEEETGLIAPNPSTLYLLEDGPRLCVAALLPFSTPAQQLAAAIQQHNDLLEFPEIARPHIFQKNAPLPEKQMPPFARNLARFLLSSSS